MVQQSRLTFGSFDNKLRMLELSVAIRKLHV
jgi:hypothetical protein